MSKLFPKQEQMPFPGAASFGLPRVPKINGGFTTNMIPASMSSIAVNNIKITCLFRSIFFFYAYPIVFLNYRSIYSAIFVLECKLG